MGKEVEVYPPPLEEGINDASSRDFNLPYKGN